MRRVPNAPAARGNAGTAPGPHGCCPQPGCAPQGEKRGSGRDNREKIWEKGVKKKKKKKAKEPIDRINDQSCFHSLEQPM